MTMPVLRTEMNIHLDTDGKPFWFATVPIVIQADTLDTDVPDMAAEAFRRLLCLALKKRENASLTITIDKPTEQP